MQKKTSFEYSAIGEGEEITLAPTSEQEGNTDINCEEWEQEYELASEDEDPNDDFIEDASSGDDEEGRFTELEVTATGVITGCSIFGGSSLRSMCQTEANEAVQGNLHSSDDEDDELKCQICKKRFSHQTNKMQHKCKGATGKHGLVHFALTYAYDRIDRHDFGIIMIREDADKGALGELLDRPTNLEMTAVWAHPPKHGKMYGKITMTHSRRTLQECSMLVVKIRLFGWGLQECLRSSNNNTLTGLTSHQKLRSGKLLQPLWPNRRRDSRLL
jgi:hypothetical protein